MSQFVCYVDNIHYNEVDSLSYIYMSGWCIEKNRNKVEYQLEINGDKYTDFTMFHHNRKDIVNKYGNYTDGNNVGFFLRVKGYKGEIHSLKLIAMSKEESFVVKEFSSNALKKIKSDSSIMYSVDSLDIDNNKYILQGWAFSLDGKEIHYTLLDSDENIIKSDLQLTMRNDLVQMGIVEQEHRACGFFMSFETDQINQVNLKLSTEGSDFVEVSIKKEIDRNKIHIWNRINSKNIKKAFNFIRKGDFKGLLRKLKGTSNPEEDYNEWCQSHDVTQDELEKQRKTHFNYQPKMSLVVATFNTPIPFLKEMIDTVVNQSYTNWELCIADGSTNSCVKEYVVNNYAKESRIKMVSLPENYGIAGNMNEAIKIATGDFIGLYDHDDVLTLDALYEFVQLLNEHPNAEIIYSDEDKIDSKWTKRFEPHFKTDFNIDLLCTNNYICHLLFVKKSLIDQVGLLRSEYDGAQDHDFILRCSENTDPVNIYHIPRVLYHWRIHENSTAGNPESKMYAFDAGVKAVQHHYDRIGISAKVSHGKVLGFYQAEFILDTHPMVSIIIPNKDHIDDLDRCLQSIYNKSTYDNYEIVIVENNSKEKETFEYYENINKDNVHVVYWDGEFNYSAINNFGVQYTTGEYLLLLNNDTEVINPKWIEEMLGYCTREDVGIVGAKLYYPDDTIQHAGVVIGLGGIAGHIFAGYQRDDYGYFGHLFCAMDYSAVTAACLMVKRSVYEEVNGLDPKYQVAFNDVDFCLKVREKGYLVVYNPKVELYHFESKSRGFENTASKVERFSNEITTFYNRWKKILQEGDPFYNRNLTLENGNCTLNVTDRSIEEMLGIKGR